MSEKIEICLKFVRDPDLVVTFYVQDGQVDLFRRGTINGVEITLVREQPEREPLNRAAL